MTRDRVWPLVLRQKFTRKERLIWALTGCGLGLFGFGLLYLYNILDEGWGKEALVLAMVPVFAGAVFAPVRALFDVDRTFTLMPSTVTIDSEYLMGARNDILMWKDIETVYVQRIDHENSRDAFRLFMKPVGRRKIMVLEYDNREDADAMKDELQKMMGVRL